MYHVVQHDGWGRGDHHQLFPRQRSKDDVAADINKPSQMLKLSHTGCTFTKEMSHIFFWICVMSYEWKECGSVLFQPADKILYGDLCGQSRVFHVESPLSFFMVPTPKKLTIKKQTFALCCCYCAKADDCSVFVLFFL